jgi:hypothetical protein
LCKFQCLKETIKIHGFDINDGSTTAVTTMMMMMMMIYEFSIDHVLLSGNQKELCPFMEFQPFPILPK